MKKNITKKEMIESIEVLEQVLYSALDACTNAYGVSDETTKDIRSKWFTAHAIMEMINGDTIDRDELIQQMIDFRTIANRHMKYIKENIA